jgi:hypothetical protein
VYVNGVALDLDEVEYRISLTHGRNDITAAPAPSDASMTLYGFTSPDHHLSDVVEVEAYGVTRFTGRVTDTQLSHDFNPNGPTVGAPVTSYVARLDVTMIGNLSLLGLAFVGAAGYSKELLNDRVENILTDSNLVYTNNSDPLMTQEALDALDGGYSALDLLTALGTETGGTLCDLPDGAVLWESYSRRGYGYNPAHWTDIDPTDTWPDIPYIWADVYDRVDTAPLTVGIPKAGRLVPDVAQHVPDHPQRRHGHLRRQRQPVPERHRPGVDHHATGAERSRSRRSCTRRPTRSPGPRTSSAPSRSPATRCSPSRSSWRKSPSRCARSCSTSSRVARSGSTTCRTRHPSTTTSECARDGPRHTRPDSPARPVTQSDPRFSYQVVKWNEIDPALLWSGVDLTVQWYNVVIPADLVA